MSSSNKTLRSGESIFHPKYGLGTVHGLTHRDPVLSSPAGVSSEAELDQTQNYYDIHLLEGGTLLVPVSRAESVGVRRLINGVEAIKECLSAPAQRLPENSRERAATLRARGQAAEPTAIAAAVRDLLVQRRGQSLSAGEKTWLDKSCEWLSSEAALVDGIVRSQAQAAIWEAMNQLNTT